MEESMRAIVHIEMQALHHIQDQSRRLERDQFIGNLRILHDTNLLQLLIERRSTRITIVFDHHRHRAHINRRRTTNLDITNDQADNNREKEPIPFI